jgi:twitching motility protein PilT
LNDIIEIIKTAKEQGASDIHMAAGSPVMFRVRGELTNAGDSQELSHEDMQIMFDSITSEDEQAEFQKNLELDFGYNLPEVTRLRCNAARQRGSISLVMRLIANSIPPIDSLRIPNLCKQLILKPRGMLVVSGPTGSGKSTTMAAMIDHLNHTQRRRVVTIEDPIEYVYTSLSCNITQRELGADTKSFAEALRHVLRQDPDVILVGEMRDLETASAALTIAETGHLVLTTGHAPSTYQAIERIVDMFPPHERSLAQTRLSSLLIGVLCQALVPTKEGNGRVPAIEIMLANSAVRNLIREGKIHQLPNTIRTSTKMGMQLLDQSLVELFRADLIAKESIYAFCNDPDDIDKLITSIDEDDLEGFF